MPQFPQVLLKLESLKLVCELTMSCCIVELRIRLIALVLPFIYPFFSSLFFEGGGG